jgi:hypothetical protein
VRVMGSASSQLSGLSFVTGAHVLSAGLVRVQSSEME